MVFVQLSLEDWLEIPELYYLAKSNLVSYPILSIIFDDMLYYILDEMKTELIQWIGDKVPKRTSQLRDMMIKHLELSTIQNGLLKLEIGSLVDYMTELNLMTTSRVSHFGEWGWADYYGYDGKVWLYDPLAIGNFWDKLITFTLNRLNFITQRAVDEYFGGTGKLMKDIRGNITIKVK